MEEIIKSGDIAKFNETFKCAKLDKNLKIFRNIAIQFNRFEMFEKLMKLYDYSDYSDHQLYDIITTMIKYDRFEMLKLLTYVFNISYNYDFIEFATRLNNYNICEWLIKNYKDDVKEMPFIKDAYNIALKEGFYEIARLFMDNYVELYFYGRGIIQVIVRKDFDFFKEIFKKPHLISNTILSDCFFVLFDRHVISDFHYWFFNKFKNEILFGRLLNSFAKNENIMTCKWILDNNIIDGYWLRKAYDTSRINHDYYLTMLIITIYKQRKLLYPKSYHKIAKQTKQMLSDFTLPIAIIHNNYANDPLFDFHIFTIELKSFLFYK